MPKGCLASNSVACSAASRDLMAVLAVEKPLAAIVVQRVDMSCPAEPAVGRMGCWLAEHYHSGNTPAGSIAQIDVEVVRLASFGSCSRESSAPEFVAVAAALGAVRMGSKKQMQ